MDLLSPELSRAVVSAEHIKSLLEQVSLELLSEKDTAVCTVKESVQRMKQHIDQLQQKLLDDIEYKHNMESTLIHQKIETGERLINSANDCHKSPVYGHQNRRDDTVLQSLNQYINENKVVNQLHIKVSLNQSFEQNVLQCYSIGDAVITRMKNILLSNMTHLVPSTPVDPDIDPPPYSEVAHIQPPPDAQEEYVAAGFSPQWDSPSDYGDLESETEKMRIQESNDQSQHLSSAFDVPPRMLVPLTAFSAKSTEDNESCHFSGVAFLDNENVVLADKNNRKLKLCDVVRISVTEAALEHKPLDVTQAPDGMIAVSLPKHGAVHIFPTDLVPPISQNTLHVKGCRSLASSYNFLFVCYGESGEEGIRLFNRDYQFVRSIKCSPDGPISVCPTGQFIYYKYCRMGKDKIVCLNQYGDTVWKTKVQSWVDDPSGMVAVRSGLIIALLDKLVFLGSHGRWSDLCHFESPGAVDVNIDCTKLVVTSWQSLGKDESTKVKIFNIRYY